MYPAGKFARGVDAAAGFGVDAASFAVTLHHRHNALHLGGIFSRGLDAFRDFIFVDTLLPLGIGVEAIAPMVNFEAFIFQRKSGVGFPKIAE